MDSVETQASAGAGDGAGVREEARGAIAISIGQGALMLAGGLLALLITQFFGKGAATDAFFTAYGFYVIALAFTQTLRLTALPRLLGDVTGEQESRLVAAAAVMGLIAAVPMLALADPVGDLIADGDPTGIAAQTLRLLWPALALHLLAGVLVPMLTVRGIFAPIGVAYGLAGAVSVLSFLLLQPELGLKAVAAGLSISAALPAATLALVLRREGVRPPLRAAANLRRTLAESGGLVIASASFLVINVGYLICLAVAGREPVGDATNYAYAFFAATLFVSVTAIPSAMVRAPRLLDDTGAVGITPGDVAADYRVALLLLTPAFGLTLVVAVPLTELIAGSFFTATDAGDLVAVLMALAPWVLSMVVAVMVILELLNRGHTTTLARLAAVHALALLPLAIAGRIAGGIVAIALAQSAAMTAATAIQLLIAFKPGGVRVIARLLRETVRAAAVGTAAFTPALAFTWLTRGDTAVIVAALIGAIVYAAIARQVFAREWRLIADTLGRRRQPAT